MAEAQAGHILLVEDDPFILDALAELLEGENYVVHKAAHGGHGIDALARGTPFGLILLDLMMPEVSGLMFRRTQLQRADWASIPTVVLTADACAASRLHEVNNATLVEKPLNLADLLHIVRSHCLQSH